MIWIVTTIVAVGVILNGIEILLLLRRSHRQEAEITELQAMVDTILLKTEGRPYFAGRYDIEFVIDPAKMAPPRVPDDG